MRHFAVIITANYWGGVIFLPNRIAPHRVMHERFGDVTPEDVAEEIHEDLSSPESLRKTREEFLALSGEAGAASRLCDIVCGK
ncbi:MAG: hypothetical protein IJS28_11575 [Synergistaceae bacterium]|nr:hypothetical protein [Synergistaceae bacterium]